VRSEIIMRVGKTLILINAFENCYKNSRSTSVKI